MSEQSDVIDSLDEVGVLAGIQWAYLSATSRVLADYSEAAGHDATWLGITRYNQFRDRLDRVFACGRYAVPIGSHAAASLDVLHAELTDRDIKAMPRFAPDLVARSDLNGSPGWVWEGWRWLLASCSFGKLDELPWLQKSPTKQRVAQQLNQDPDQASLFGDLVDDEIPGLTAMLATPHQLDRETLVVAHSQDHDSDARELVIGRARLNSGGGKAWHWRHDLLSSPRAGGGNRLVDGPLPSGPDTVDDAPVRLRRPANGQTNGRASGDS